MKKIVTWAGSTAVPILVLLLTLAPASGRAKDYLEWRPLPEPVGADGRATGAGLDGAFVGVHNDALIVAGGASHPGGGSYSDGVYLLVRAGEGDYRWVSDPSPKLPRPLAYGASASTGRGVVCAGGCDGERCYGEAFLLRRPAGADRVEIEELPPLPRALGFMGGTARGDVVYVAGGREDPDSSSFANAFFALDLGRKGEDGFGWQELAPLPGPGRSDPAMAAQNSGAGYGLYLFGGSSARLPDMRFDLKAGAWESLEDGFPGQDCAWGGGRVSAAASGVHHLLVFGVNCREGESLLAYHTITGTWSRAGAMEGVRSIRADVAGWGRDFIVLGGASGPGQGSGGFFRVSPKRRSGFGPIDHGVLFVYLAVMMAMGVYFSRREKTTDDYFKAGGRVPGWAVGLSIFGTAFSTIAFMSVPAIAYTTDLTYLPFSFAQFLAVPVVIALYLPVFRRLKVTTSYEYLEMRFNLATRLAGSLLFLIFQFGRLGIVLLLPAIALSLVTGIDIQLCIVAIGVLSIIYTVMGGIEAVIWTDVLQVIVLMGGALVCLLLMVFGHEGGVVEFGRTAWADGKLHTFDLAATLSRPSLWVVFLGAFAYTLIYAGSDQSYVQRYQTTRTEKAAAWGLWVFGLILIPSGLLFYGLGTALYVFFKSRPEALDPTLGQADAIFPWYIVTQLPAGVSGILIAGLFAASMSSLDSSMNSAAAVVTTDFYRRFRPGAGEESFLRFARRVTVIVGVAGTGFALLMSTWEIRSLWEEFLKTIGLLVGGLGGIFLLGIVSRRANATGAVIGLIGSVAVQYAVAQYTSIHLSLYTFTGFVSSMLIGYLASLVFPGKARDKYTLYEVKHREDEIVT